jgi:hypothetical protein
MSDDDVPESDDPMARLAERRALEKQPLDEAGQGESEGFELAEEALVEHASHGDQHSTQPILRDSTEEREADPEISGEADTEEQPDSGDG